MGPNETGGTTALPIWNTYMARVMKGVKEVPVKPPEGVIAIGGDFYLQEFPPRESAPMPMLPTQVPPTDASSALPSNASAPQPATPAAPVSSLQSISSGA